MCGVAEAQLVLGVVTTVASFRNQKDTYKRNMAADEKTMEFAQSAYLDDLSKIDNETSRAEQARSLEQLRMRQELTKNHAYALNSGFGNSLRVVQDISGAHDIAYGELIFDFERDIMTLKNQEDDAYANMVRTYSGIAPKSPPSLLGSGLAIAGHGLDYAGNPNKGINWNRNKNKKYDDLLH
jgi:hypothetical protein